MKTLDRFHAQKKNFSQNKMTQKPQSSRSSLSTRTTPIEEFSYIFMVLKELLKMLIESLTTRRNPVRMNAKHQ